MLRIKDESETGPAADLFVGEGPWRTVVDGTTTQLRRSMFHQIFNSFSSIFSVSPTSDFNNFLI